jgi:CrcB protein
MEKLFWIAFAGALGTLARYWAATYIQRRSGSDFPWGVFAVNMLGSFVFGFLWALSEQRGWVTEDMVAFALAGFLGAFTTFSAFSFSNAQLARAANWQFFMLNIVLTNAIGIVLAFAGLRAGRAV